MSLSPRDYHHSMKLSPRSKGRDREDGLRSLLVHRLRDAAKAVLRLPLTDNIATAEDAQRYKIHCEPCGKWFPLNGWAEELQCPHCSQLYVIEFAVFSAVPAPAETSR
ncbi:hypothetical protein [Streptomyces mirabilis]|uniref:hypothetical protein n=1 Tax=Streptomyces mirabilis TaxID=68239 RepID=UPI0036AF767A